MACRRHCLGNAYLRLVARYCNEIASRRNRVQRLGRGWRGRNRNTGYRTPRGACQYNSADKRYSHHCRDYWTETCKTGLTMRQPGRQKRCLAQLLQLGAKKENSDSAPLWLFSTSVTVSLAIGIASPECLCCQALNQGTSHGYMHTVSPAVRGSWLPDRRF
jgi:hypothetical protein